MPKFYPLSKSEEGLYFSSLEGGDAYNLANTINLGKEINPKDVENALRKVFEAHPYLFTVLSVNEDGIIQKSIEKEDIKLECEKVNELNIDSLPYELLNHHLYRFKLFNVKDEYIFYFDFHHIIMDGTSLKIFIDDFLSALEGNKLEEEKETANEYALKEAESLNKKEYLPSKEYFEKLVGDVETDSTLVEDKIEETISYHNIRRKILITDKEVKSITKPLKIKTSTFFLTAFGYLLARFNMDDKALFLTVNNARNEGVRRSFGSYVKTYPFYIDFDNNKIEDILRKVDLENCESPKHLDYPFMMMNKDLGVSADILFAYQGDYFYKGT